MEMSLGLVIVIMAFIVFTIAIVLGVLHYRRLGRRLRTKVNIIHKDKSIKIHWLRNPSESFTVGEHKYMFDSKATVKRKYYDEIFYYVESPHPIFFNTDTSNIEISSKNLKAYIENDLIVQLFKGNIYSLENILLIVCIVGVGVCALLLAKLVLGGVTIANSPENIELLKGVIKGVIG